MSSHSNVSLISGGSRRPSVPTVFCGTGNRPRYSSSLRRWGRRACSWLHTGLRSSGRSLQHTMITRLSITGTSYQYEKLKRTRALRFMSKNKDLHLVNVTHICNRRTADSGTWWPQTSQRQNLQRQVLGHFRSSLSFLGPLCSDLQRNQNKNLVWTKTRNRRQKCGSSG